MIKGSDVAGRHALLQACMSTPCALEPAGVDEDDMVLHLTSSALTLKVMTSAAHPPPSRP